MKSKSREALQCGDMFYDMHFAAGVEWTSPSMSAFSTTLVLVFYPVGLMVLPCIAYLVGDWRNLQAALFSPLIIIWGLFYWSAKIPVFILSKCYNRGRRCYIRTCVSNKVSPGVSSLAPDPGQEGGGQEGAPESSQGEREEAAGGSVREGQRGGRHFISKSGAFKLLPVLLCFV